jgi:hypothetical protein
MSNLVKTAKMVILSEAQAAFDALMAKKFPSMGYAAIFTLDYESKSIAGGCGNIAPETAADVWEEITRNDDNVHFTPISDCPPSIN